MALLRSMPSHPKRLHTLAVKSVGFRRQKRNGVKPRATFFSLDRCQLYMDFYCQSNNRFLLPRKNLYLHITIPQTSQLTLGFPLWGVHFMGLHRCRMTYIQHDSIIQNTFMTPNFLSALPIHLSHAHPKPWQPLILWLSLWFYLFQNVLELESKTMKPLQMAFLHLVMHIEDSFTVFPYIAGLLTSF